MPVEQPEPLLTPSLSQVILAALASFQDDLHTAAWGTVVGYDAASQSASIQLAPRPFINDDGDRDTELPAPLAGVPVLFQGSGPYSMTFPIQAGDSVLVVFGEHSFEGGSSGQITADTGDDRKHTLSDAVCIPGLRSKGSRVSGPPPNDALVITAPKIQLGSKSATKNAAHVPGVQQAFEDVFTDDTLMGAFATYQAAVASGVGVVAARAALVLAFNAHFLSKPVQGASKVLVE
jgi:hypothetical protein